MWQTDSLTYALQDLQILKPNSMKSRHNGTTMKLYGVFHPPSVKLESLHNFAE